MVRQGAYVYERVRQTERVRERVRELLKGYGNPEKGAPNFNRLRKTKISHTLDSPSEYRRRKITAMSSESSQSSQDNGVNEIPGERRYNDSHYFLAKLKVRAHVETVKEIRNALTNTQKKLFKTCCFGQFFKMETLKHSSSLLHSVLFRQINKGVVGEEMWFRLNGVDCRFGPVEFALITGLKFSREMVKRKVIGKSRLKSQYFPGKKAVSYGDLAAVFKERVWIDNDDDAIKISALYLLHFALLGSDNRKTIPENILSIFDDWDTFNSYPWGTLVWKMTVKSLGDALVKQYNEVSRLYPSNSNDIPILTYGIRGCTLAFQVWIYETLNNLKRFVVCKSVKTIPRMLRWKSLEVPSWEDMDRILNSSEDVVTSRMIASKVERQSWYYEDVINDIDDLEESDTTPDAPSSPPNIQPDVTSPPDILYGVTSPPDIQPAPWSTPVRRRRSSFISSHVPSPQPAEETHTCNIPSASTRMDDDKFDRLQELLQGFMQKVDERLESIDERQTLLEARQISIEAKLTELQHKYHSNPTSPTEVDEPTEVLFEYFDQLDTDIQQTMDGTNKTQTENRSITRRTLRGRIMKKGKALRSPYTDPFEHRRARAVIGASCREDIVNLMWEYLQWYGDPPEPGLGNTYLYGPCDKIKWWKLVCEDNHWLMDQHIDSYLVVLRHTFPSAKWTCVETSFDGWLPHIIKEREDYRLDNYRWPRLLLDPIEGINDSDLHRGYISWANVDRVYIPINYESQHWACGELDLNAWTLTVYDSSKAFFDSTEKFLEAMKRYSYLPSIINATNYWESRGLEPKLDPLTITRCIDVPQQGTASGDCGIFSLFILEYLATGRRLTFRASNASVMRCMVASRIWRHGGNTIL
ncbi:uncharacterized protein LOC123224293 [Mangifera indica]|uniref:uncharacterized protein LOC123224293 n=1 Tax=Mangifera indica TaxID=29780 RepID=UPI001CFBB87C|nr:uncharacterized protein LOC123224293 [Mangifera indica]